MKQIIKIFSVLIITLICFTVTSYGTLDWATIRDQANTFINKGENPTTGGPININAKDLVQRTCKHTNNNRSCDCINRNPNYWN